MGISLRYSNEPLTSLTFGSSSNQREFDPLVNKPPFPVRDTLSGKMLNGRRYSHKTHTYLRFDITISVDELIGSWGSATVPPQMPTGLSFLREFLLADYKYLSYPTGWSYIEVISENDIQVEYLDDNIYLPEFRLQLITASPATNDQMTNLALKPVEFL